MIKYNTLSDRAGTCVLRGLFVSAGPDLTRMLDASSRIAVAEDLEVGRLVAIFGDRLGRATILSPAPAFYPGHSRYSSGESAASAQKPELKIQYLMQVKAWHLRA